MKTIKVKDIRKEFKRLYTENKFVSDKNGGKVIEIISASFVADENHIFDTPNLDYIKREIEWYESMSLFVEDIPGNTPKIWKEVASKNGMINSNYGWMIYSEKNFNQYGNVLRELIHNPSSRRATMIYNRPEMWLDYNRDGMSDFCCTYAHQYFIRSDNLDVYVTMRSNDAWAGYRNDFAWAKHVQEKLVKDYNYETGSSIKSGQIYWNVGSLHVYEKQFNLVEHFVKTGLSFIQKD